MRPDRFLLRLQAPRGRAALLIAMAFSAALMACDRAERAPQAMAPGESAGPGPQDSRETAFARDMIALKARGLAPDAVDAAVRELRTRYGYPILEARAAAPIADEGTAALAKSEAIGSKWKTVKSFSFGFPLAIKQSFVISNQGTLHAWTAISANEEGVDPVLIAYYRTSGTSTAHRVKVVAYNDDAAAGSLQPEITWTNTTGGNVTVDVLAFVFSAESQGTVKLFVRHSIFPVTDTYVTHISAYPLWDNTASGGIAGCSGPWSSRLRLVKTAGGGYAHGLLGINGNNLTGGEIVENSATLDVGTVIPSGRYNMVIGYVPWDLSKTEDGTQYSAFQDNRFDCFQ
jgi:hypothetical protein